MGGGGGRIKIKCDKCFNNGQSAPDKLYTVDAFIGGDFYTKKRLPNLKNLTARISFFSFFFSLSGSSTVCSVSARWW